MRRAGALLALALAGCGPKAEPPPTKVATTYRALTGISMGGMGAGELGFRHPERFDAIAALGGPMDAALLLRTIDRFHTAGFCPLDELEANLATLNDPARAGCDTHPPPLKYERVQDFNRWAFTTNTPFDRTAYLGLFTDLTLAFGNLLTENPSSTFAPPGTDDAAMRHPSASFCTSPVRVKGLKNAEYNPEGRYDAITFCDGEPLTWYCQGTQNLVDFCSDQANIARPLPRSAEAGFAQAWCTSHGGAAAVADRASQPAIMLRAGGRYDACRQPFEPVRVALAWDLNDNGRRDYGEPIVNNGQERFDDVGTDGCSSSREDGAGGCRATEDPAAVDPNHDDYDPLTNPSGAEGNWAYDDGEPFRDHGLDGVPGSGDFGEGSGVFDMTLGRRRLYAHDARTNLRSLTAAQLVRLNLLVDGGIRDQFNFGLQAHQLHGLWRSLRPNDTGTYRDFAEIPGMRDPRFNSFRPWGGPWKRAPRNLEVLYGLDEPTEHDRLAGDGDHVGTNGQAVNRLAVLFNWVAVQWQSLPRPTTPFTGLTYGERVRVEWYDSTVLAAKREYGIFLPPGYDAPENADARYPVMVLMHGYQGDPTQILPSALLADTFMKDPDVKLRPMIIVAPSGACCYVEAGTGKRDCRQQADDGTPLAGAVGWRGECVAGSFFVSQVGGTKYEESLFELLEVVDQRYRTLTPAEVEAR